MDRLLGAIIRESVDAGDLCLVCRRPFSVGCATVSGWRQDGSYTLACEDCEDAVVAVGGVGVFAGYPARC